MKPPFDSSSSSVGRGVGVLLSRTRALSRNLSRQARSATENGGIAEVTVLPNAAAPSTASATSTPTRTSSWRNAKSSFSKPRTKINLGKTELLNLAQVRGLRNVRESKLAELTERPGYLTSFDFDNKSFSLDELHLAAVVLLERCAPGAVFSDRAGVGMLYAFVESVRAMYKPNPYHDFRHAVDVMQFMNGFLSREEVANRVLPQEGGQEVHFLMLVACLCHDAGHDGSSNVILRKTRDPLVEKYGEESTLERLHAALGAELLEASGLLAPFDVGSTVMDPTRFLTEVRALILATDMEKHSALLQAFRVSPSAQMLNVLIKFSDISNVARPFEEAKVWSARLAAEMRIANGRLEAIGETVPPPVPLAVSTVGFSKLFALPLADALTEAGLLETGRELRARIELNISAWESHSQDALNPGL